MRSKRGGGGRGVPQVEDGKGSGAAIDWTKWEGSGVLPEVSAKKI